MELVSEPSRDADDEEIAVDARNVRGERGELFAADRERDAENELVAYALDGTVHRDEFRHLSAPIPPNGRC
jgi:hypothetical protein